jgi:hypothetical protein
VALCLVNAAMMSRVILQAAADRRDATRAVA